MPRGVWFRGDRGKSLRSFFVLLVDLSLGQPQLRWDDLPLKQRIYLLSRLVSACFGINLHKILNQHH
jgi:hypothetical protein